MGVNERIHPPQRCDTLCAARGCCDVVDDGLPGRVGRALVRCAGGMFGLKDVFYFLGLMGLMRTLTYV